MLINQSDIDFIFAQLTLPGNDPRNAPLGTVADPTGIRDVQGVGNNVLNPLIGAADQQFLRLTNPTGSTAPQTTPPSQLTPPGTIPTPGSGPATGSDVPSAPANSGGFTQANGVLPTDVYARPNTMVSDPTPRVISNLVADQSPEALAAIGYVSPGQQKLAILDNPSLTPGGRLNPFTGADNPLPYSTFTTMFGQFFDHGLDLVHKGAGGVVVVPLLPGDPLYVEGSPTNFMIASRTNTVEVGIGATSTDSLITSLGLGTFTGNNGLVDKSAASVTGTTFTAPSAAGVLMINGVAIQIAAGRSLAQVVNLINAQEGLTGVTASASGNTLKLDAPGNQSVNVTSPFIDLSQSYGSAASHTVFVREYDANGNITGRLVSGTTGGMATWADIKANALNIGIILNDRDVLDIPEIRFLTNIAGGAGYFDANGEAWLVARHLVTGAVYYVQNSDIAANTEVLDAQGNAANTSVLASLRLQTIGHAFLDDIAHTANLTDSRGRALQADTDNVVNGDTNGDGVINGLEVAVDPTRFDNELLDQHFVAGDGRTNENIGLTAIHDVFHSEHAKVLDQIKGLMTVDLVDPNLMVDVHGNKWTGEMLFQAAKLVTEMEYQHLVFGEFVRKLSPNITAFAGYNVTLDPAITAEFAHAVYRFGHSMLTETVGLQQFDPVTGKAIADVVVDATSLAVTADKNELTVTLSAAHNLHTGNYVDLSGITTGLGGLDAKLLNGSFKVVGVISSTELVLELAVAAANTDSAGSLSAVKAGLNSDVGLIEAFLNPMAYSHTTAGEFAIGSSQQVGNGIDIWVTDALRNNLVGLPLDLATLNIVRGRDAGMLSLNGVRNELFTASNITTLKPYTSWTEFRDNLVHQETLVNFVMAYSRDAVLNNFGVKDAATWDADVRKTGTEIQKAAYYTEYAAALRTAGEAAIADGAFMTFDQGFNSIDFWLGGLAEKAVNGGMLGSTFDFIFATQMVKLQDADRFYYLNRLAGTNMLAEIEAQLFSDVVMRNTGAQNLYSDIFSVPDSTVYLENVTTRVFNTAFDLGTAANQINATDINGDTVKVSTAGWALNPDGQTWTFYGNPGNYLDARGVLNANGFGHASEVIVGYDDATVGKGDRINANGGNDTVWGKKGNDTIEGGNGNDFLHGGDGNDVMTDIQGDDLLWGDAGDDSMDGGSGLDQVFGGDGQDTIYGGTGADVIEGGRGDDLIFGDTGSAPSVVGDLSGADVIAGGEGQDTMYGGGGADVMDGGEGDDVIYGGAGADGMTGGLGFGNDVFIMDAVDAIGNAMNGGLGFDTVDYTASNGQVLTLNGPVVGLHLNLSVPNALADSFADIENLIGTRFNDTLVGGAAIVNVYMTDANGQPILDQNNRRILDLLASTAASVGFDILNDLGDPVIGVDPVTGDPVLVAENVLIQGGAGDDIVTGGQGNDTLDGGAVTGRTGPGYVPLANDPNSADTLSGGLGNDVYVVDSNNDVVIEGVLIDVFGLPLLDAAGNTTPELVQGIDRVDTTLATYSIRNLDTIENLRYIGVGNFNGTGNILNNVITGGVGNDTLNGREGIDTLVGGAGNDTYTVDSTTDVITELAAGGTDRVNATLAAGLTYTLNAEVENLTLQGNAASNGTGNTLANVITGNGAANVLTSVANTLSGTFDTLVGGAGNDTYVVDQAGVVITETANNGTDTVSTSFLSAFTLSAANVENLIYTGVGNFAGTGSATANIITGGTGNDTLDGAAGNDTLIGGNGNDTLIGNTGVDSMTGGAGIDTFVFVAGSSGTATNRDRIVDFTVGTDKIDLSSFGALQFIGSGNFTTVGQVRAVTVGNVTTVEVNTAGNNGSELSVDLTGALNLTAADFSSNVTVAPPTPPTPPGPPVVPNGPAAALNLTGTNAANTLTGDTGNDTLSGGRGNDTIDGGAGNDVLNGGRDADVITGGLGNDVLTGGTGADAFIFNSVLNGTTNVDNITDFTAVDDTIRLENAIFTALTATGTLNANFLRLGTAAADNNDYIIYDVNSGNLWYDADANGAGAQVLFATLSNQEVLTRNDFVVI